MVDIVVVGTSPEWEEMVQAPGELVSRMRIDRLEETADDPQVHGDNMQVLGERAEDDRDTDGAEGKDHGFEWRSIFSSQAERRTVLMVEFVNHLVQARRVEGSVKPIMPCIFQDKEQSDLPCHCGPVGERHGGGQAEELSHRVKEPDLRQLDGEMRQENELRACPLFSECGHFLLHERLAGFEAGRIVRELTP